MRITFEPTQDHSGLSTEATHLKVLVEHRFDDLNINEVGNMIRAALIGWGFAEQTVDELFGGEE